MTWKRDRRDNFLQSGAIVSINDQTVITGSGNALWKSLNDSNKPTFYFPQFFLERETPWLHFIDTEIVDRSIFSSLIEKPQTFQIIWDDPDQKEFFSQTEVLQSLIEQRILQKGVPYVFTNAKLKICKKWICHCLYHALEYVENFGGYLYGFWNEREGMIGVTPELLFQKVEPNRLETMACAGTIGSQNVQESHKLDAEHQFVVDAICDSLEPFGVRVASQSRWRTFHSLSHLITNIDVRLNQPFSFSKIVNALHPTPALGTYPKKEGENWLLQHDARLPRGRYGAPVGFYDQRNDRASTFVGIRNVQWKDQQVRIGAGCGVIRESVVNAEWEEILLKIESVKSIFCL